MKNKSLPILGLALGSVLALTGCNGQAITQEKAKANLQKAQEKVEEANAYTVNVSSNITAAFSATLNDSTTSTSLTATNNIKGGVKLNEEKTSQEKSFITTDINLSSQVNNEAAETVATQSTKLYFVNDSLYSQIDSSKSKVSLTTEILAEYSASIDIPGFSASFKLDLNELVENVVTKYSTESNVEYRQSFGKTMYIYHIQESAVKSTASAALSSTTSDNTDTTTSTLIASLMSEFTVSDSYVKFTFNQNATFLELESVINANATKSLEIGSTKASVSFSYASADKITFNLSDNLSDSDFPSTEELNNWVL